MYITENAALSTSGYQEFLQQKSVSDVFSGFDADDLNPHLFDFQRAIVKWALRKGRCAVFADTGLGKTLTQLSWADSLCKQTGGKVLIVAPLCVAQQTLEEGLRFGVAVKYCRHQSEVADAGIVITNYEMLDKFDASEFIGVVLDESSILKGFDSSTRKMVIDKFRDTPYKMSCTATPSPNDYMELGGQAEFIGIMRSSEMLAMFFTHDGGDTARWRLKGHGKNKFWEWLATWAVFIRSPADLGFDGSRYALPPLTVIPCELPSANPRANTMRERLDARRSSVKERCEFLAGVVNGSNEPWVIWCNLNDESTLLAKLIPDAVEVHGSLKMSEKERRITSFSHGAARVIISKAKICGFGLNWQHCRNVACFADDSFEKYYQAVRRCYRFGQTKEVFVWMVYTTAEGTVKENIERKQLQADVMTEKMLSHMRDFTKREVVGTFREITDYLPTNPIALPEWMTQ
jgi:hypothetical protein